MNIVKASLKHKQVTLTILLMVFAVGVYSLLTMPRREDPKFTMPQAIVVSYYPGATAAQVEEQVTDKIEKYLFQFEEVQKAKTHSTTRDGVSIVYVWLNDNAGKPDIFWSKLRHQLMIVKALDLPEGVRGPILNSDFGDTEAMLISIESDNADYAQLRDCAKILEYNLRNLPAASKIKLIGEQKEQITASFNSAKLSQYGISMMQIVKVLQTQNSIGPTGDINTVNKQVSFYTTGYYKTEEDVKNQIVGTSKTGAVVRLGDIATIKREYSESSGSLKVNGHKALIVSVQMLEGNNIVWFGEDVNKKVIEAQKLLPSNVNLTTIVNQPTMVQHKVSDFLLEFLIAIVAVILVIVLLLPLRVAAVATTAIPMTIATTIALMHIFGIELHQVSLIALIVVLGMVVDDAIVVADNYVELLDQGIDRWTAAWRSAYDLVVPIFTATITIIASFMPIIILTGAIGDFLHDFPITVSIALASSFIVAMVLTPMLCFFFIRKGLNDETNQKSINQKKTVVLNLMQAAYNKTIDWCVKHPVITIGGSLVTIILAVVLFTSVVKHRFMPYAERNQFVVELWMPTGTKTDKTQDAIDRVEKRIKEDKRVVSYATFAGMSAPRIYYNFSPEFPVSNYAQILINTTSNKSTEEFAADLTNEVEDLVPEGKVQVRLMQQGLPLISPIEIRIYGDDIHSIKSIGEKVKNILKNAPGSAFVQDNFKEDFYGISIHLKGDANRLGFTTLSISQLVYTSFKGYPVSTMYEGNDAVDIVLRLDSNERQTVKDLENLYLESPVTGAMVPLRQIAELKPEWQIGRIMHRNGRRCLTIYSEAPGDLLPSELLKSVRTQIDSIPLPPGYELEYGGEEASKIEVFNQLFVALAISIVLIFLILFFQFKNLKEVSIVLLTILLSLFGAMMGLFITGNYFGLTSFAGIISLSGIVVRNAIILIDHTNELIKQGIDIKTAAVESGKRRLRPIFLTAMAAAVGVFPMIISGSSLWSPLASVIAFGVIWGMVMSLITVPVLYIAIVKPSDKKKLVMENSGTAAKTMMILSVLIFFSLQIKALQQPENLSLQKATEMALQNNHLLRIKQNQVAEKQQKVKEDVVKYFPTVVLGSTYQYNSEIPALALDKGSFGELNLGFMAISLPLEDMTIDMGEHVTLNAGAQFYQPISQLPKIRDAVKVSKTELEMLQVEQAKAGVQIKQAVEKLFYGILIAQKQKEEAEIKLLLANTKLHDVESALLAGKTTSSSMAGLNASVADEEQNLLKINIQLEDYMADLKQLTGISPSEFVKLEDISMNEMPTIASIDTSTSEIETVNNDLRMATLQKDKAQYAINASKFSYLPDVGIIGGYTYQEGLKLYPTNNSFIGVNLKWDIQGGVANRFVQNQRKFIRFQAEENILNTKEQVENNILKATRKLDHAKALIKVSEKALNYRKEDLKIQTDKRSASLNLESDTLTAKAALAKAESDFLAAQLNYRLALTELQILVGKY